MRARTGENRLALWYGILIGPLALAWCEGSNYVIAQHACSTGHFYVFNIISAIAFLFALSGAWLAWSEFQKVGPGSENGGTPHDRSWFMAILGIASSLGFVLAIIAMSVPHFILSPCD